MSWVWQAQGGGNGGGGGAPAKYPQLTQTLYSPVAQWAMDGTLPGGAGFDRTGNSNGLGFQTQMRPGPACRLPPRTGVMFPGKAPAQGVVTCNTLNATSFSGAMTLTAKVWFRDSNFGTDPPAAQVIVGGSAVSSALTTAWLYVSDVGRLGSFWDGTPTFEAVGLNMSSTGPGAWHFVSMQREAGTFVTRIGMDGVYETSGVRSAQTAPATAILRVGNWAFSPGQAWYGGMEDISMWSTRLTDAQVEGLRIFAMGL